MFSEQQKFQQIMELGIEIAKIQDIDVILEKILKAARKLAHADAGTIYIRSGDYLRFGYTQNDTLQKRLPAGKKLIYEELSIPINPYSIAGYVANTGEPLDLPDVYQLNVEPSPFAFDRAYDKKANYRTQSMLAVPLKNHHNKVLGVMQLLNAQNNAGQIEPFSKADLPIIQVFANHAALAVEQARATRNEVLGLVRILIELRDPEETEAHVNRVGACAAEIYEVWARKKGVPRHEIETNVEKLRMAAMLHDLGKLAVPYMIREKTGRFTAEEFELMKQHTVKGAQMLLRSAQSEYEKIAAEIALNHHEYWNGTGYPGHVNVENGRVIPGYEDEQGKPRGKRGEEIPIFGRVVAIADMYDALSCRRNFREALKEPEVLKTLETWSGKRFDPEFMGAFFSSLNIIRGIAQRFPEKH